MKVKLLRDQRIPHKAGEIVEVSPTVCDFLLSTHSAVVETAHNPPIPRKGKKKNEVVDRDSDS